MANCGGTCNEHDKSFKVVTAGQTRVFDGFECAVHALAPCCGHCGVRIVGHALDKDGHMFCCDHCARREGASELRDSVWKHLAHNPFYQGDQRCINLEM